MDPPGPPGPSRDYDTIGSLCHPTASVKKERERDNAEFREVTPEAESMDVDRFEREMRMENEIGTE